MMKDADVSAVKAGILPKNVDLQFPVREGRNSL